MTRFTSHQSMKSFEGQQATPEPWHLGMLTSARAGASAWVEQRMGRRTAQKRDWRGHQQQTEKRQQNLHIYSEVLSRSGSSLEEGVKISSVPCTARLPAPVCSSFSHTEGCSFPNLDLGEQRHEGHSDSSLLPQTSSSLTSQRVRTVIAKPNTKGRRRTPG